MKPALIVSLAAGLAASGPLYGQAMIGYGIGVGRAGAAGAATGAGAAGIFSGVKGTIDQPKADPAAARQATVEEIEKAKKEEAETNASAKAEQKNSEQKDQDAPAAPATWDAGTLKTSNGFVISGLQRRPTRSGYPPSAPGPVVKVDRSTPSASMDAAAATEGSQTSDDEEAQRTSPSGVFEPIVMSFGTAGQVSAGGGSSRPAPQALEIPAGTLIADLVKRFGEPILALTGISGEDYTEKYVFRTPEGARLTVLSVEGRVTSFVVDNGDTERAAL
jgi:hypothetical protein